MHYFLHFSQHLNSVIIIFILQARKLEARVARNFSMGHLVSKGILIRQNQYFEYSLCSFNYTPWFLRDAIMTISKHQVNYSA